MTHACFDFPSGGDKNLHLAGRRPSRDTEQKLTGLRDELAVAAAARPHRAAVEEVLALDAVALALLQPLDGDRRHLVFVVLQKTQRSTLAKAGRVRHEKPEPDRERPALSTVEHTVFGVVSVLHTKAVVLHQVDGQGPGPGAQADPRRTRVPWKKTPDTAASRATRRTR